MLIFVDSVDLAEIEAMRYAKGLQADELTAVHFVLDSAHAERLQRRWQHFGHVTELRTVDCFDRNLSRAAQELVLQIMAEHADTKVTVLLPRREYSPALGPAAARPHRGHDRQGGQPDPGRKRADRGLRHRDPDRDGESAASESPAQVSARDNPIELPGPQRTHVDGLTPQVADSGGK